MVERLRPCVMVVVVGVGGGEGNVQIDSLS